MCRSIVIATGVFAALALAASTAAASDARPTLRLVDDSPVAVRGAHFAARELVTVRVTSGGSSWRKRVQAGPLGGFLARFDRATIYPCTATAIVAVGATGTRAAVKLPRTMCPQPPVP